MSPVESFRYFTGVQQGILLFDLQEIGELELIQRRDRQTHRTSLGEEGEVLCYGVASSNRLFTHQFGQLKARLAKLLAEQIVEEQIGRGIDRLKEIHRRVEQTSRTTVVEENPSRRLRVSSGIEQRRSERQSRFEDMVDQHRKATDEEQQDDADQHQGDVAFVLFIVLSGQRRIETEASTTIQIELVQESHREEIDQDQEKKWNSVDNRNVEPNMNDATKDFVFPDGSH